VNRHFEEKGSSSAEDSVTDFQGFQHNPSEMLLCSLEAHSKVVNGSGLAQTTCRLSHGTHGHIGHRCTYPVLLQEGMLLAGRQLCAEDSRPQQKGAVEQGN